jgi:C4-dicarboxylate transporter
MEVKVEVPLMEVPFVESVLVEVLGVESVLVGVPPVEAAPVDRSRAVVSAVAVVVRGLGMASGFRRGGWDRVGPRFGL